MKQWLTHPWNLSARFDHLKRRAKERAPRWATLRTNAEMKHSGLSTEGEFKRGRVDKTTFSKYGTRGGQGRGILGGVDSIQLQRCWLKKHRGTLKARRIGAQGRKEDSGKSREQNGVVKQKNQFPIVVFVGTAVRGNTNWVKKPGLLRGSVGKGLEKRWWRLGWDGEVGAGGGKGGGAFLRCWFWGGGIFTVGVDGGGSFKSREKKAACRPENRRIERGGHFLRTGVSTALECEKKRSRLNMIDLQVM